MPHAASVRPSIYLQDRHFMMALGTAAFLHALVLMIWVILPKTPVLEVPVRTLNIKLGEAGEEPPVDVAASIKPVPENKNNNTVEQQLTRFFDKAPPIPKSSESLATALADAVKNSKEALKATKPLPAPEPVKPPPPVKKEEKIMPKVIKPSEQKPQQYVRNQAFDYKPLGEALPKNGGVAVGNSTSSQAEILKRYEQLISAWIEKYKVYPPEARSSGIQGRGVVRIRIDRKGNVRFVTLDKSSGYQLLDQAIMEMIRNANPLPPVPSDYQAGDLFEFKIPISFKM